jgi:hypothetical protein
MNFPTTVDLQLKYHIRISWTEKLPLVNLIFKAIARSRSVEGPRFPFDMS